MDAKLVLCLLSVLQISNTVASRPHIVFLLADDMGWNDIGYAHSSSVNTPKLDNLAGRALRLKHSYTHSICTPSRAALMTGKYPFRYGLQKAALGDIEPYGLNTHITLLPERMKSAGYQTHLVGKWHLGYCKTGYTPLQRGFETFHGFLGGSETYFTHKNMMNGGGYYDYYHNDKTFRTLAYATTDFEDHTVGLIENNTDSRPMFIFLSMQAPHAPLELPPGAPSTSNNRTIFKYMMTSLDDFTKGVINALKKKDMLDNTIFIFSSDNGGQPMHGGNNWPLRGAKHSLWEGGVRARSFVLAPEFGIDAGDYHGLFHVTDWVPTILAMAGESGQISGVDGVNQWHAMKVNSADIDDHPRKEFVYGLTETVRPNGEVVRNAGLRLRRKNDQDKVEDFKLIIGSAGVHNNWYKEGQSNAKDEELEKKKTESERQHELRDKLYNMKLHDELLEKEEVQNRDDVIETMKQKIQNEKDKGYVERPDPTTAPAALHFTDSEGPILKPGWC